MMTPETITHLANAARDYPTLELCEAFIDARTTADIYRNEIESRTGMSVEDFLGGMRQLLAPAVA